MMAKKKDREPTEAVQVYSTRKDGYRREGHHFNHRPVRYMVVDAPEGETDKQRADRWDPKNPNRGLTKQEIERIKSDVERTRLGHEPGLRVLLQDVGDEVTELEQVKAEIRAAVAKLEEVKSETLSARQERDAVEKAASAARTELARVEDKRRAAEAAVAAMEAELGK